MLVTVLDGGALAQPAQPMQPSSAPAAKPAKQAKHASAGEPAFRGGLEPKAIDILKAAGARLAAAHSMSFTAVVSYEGPSLLGPPLVYSTKSQVTMRRPDKLRVITLGDGPPSEFYYDGKHMMAFAPAENLVAVADAPPTIDGALKAAYDEALIYFPFDDVIVADPYKDLAEGLKHAFYIGQSMRGRRHDHGHGRVRDRQCVRAGLDRHGGSSAAPAVRDLFERSGALASCIGIVELGAGRRRSRGRLWIGQGRECQAHAVRAPGHPARRYGATAQGRARQGTARHHALRGVAS